MLKVAGAGLLTTVQDSGRPDAVRWGVPIGGACDPLGLKVANLLLGNAEDAAALEMTLVGPDLVALQPTVIALGGADLGARVGPIGMALRPGVAAYLRAGEHLTFSAPRDPRGSRAYLAVPGGVAVPRVLGSASTCLVGRFGGIDGRELRAGDTVRPSRQASASMAGRLWPSACAISGLDAAAPIRVLRGPHSQLLPPKALETFLESTWRASEQSDRRGVRLEGSAIDAGSSAGNLVSLPVVWGTVQLPPSGMPIVLLPDCQTVGGYPVLAIVAQVDRPRLGQLRPGDQVRFKLTDHQSAVQAFLRQQRAFADGAQQVRFSEMWGDLPATSGL